MDAPTCPHCNTTLTKVLDLPYGYWEWTGEKYKVRTTAETVDVVPWACAECLHELRDFHPQDVGKKSVTT